VVFEQNKYHVNQVIKERLDLIPYKMEYLRLTDLPDEWPTFRFQWKMSEDGVPSEDIVSKARSELAKRDQAEDIKRFKYDLAQCTVKNNDLGNEKVWLHIKQSDFQVQTKGIF
jgi:hypothetical protein